jgi:hypothetical protein
MKNILFSMSLLGILLNPLSAGYLFTLTPDPSDSYTINNPLPNGVTATSVQDVNAWLFGENLNDPAGVELYDESIGRTWRFDGNKLVNWTTLTADPLPGGSMGDFFVVEDNSTNPSTFKFEGITGNPYTGAPLVSNVYAQQEAGTKNVVIDFSLVLASSDPNDPAMGDKPSWLEFWFKSDPSSLQWEVCHLFETAGGAPGGGVGNQKEPGEINESGGFYAIWKAGEQKPNFQTSTGKIRVMVTYDHEDPNNPGGGMSQGSQWDGYEAANGPMFTNSTANTTKISYPYNKTNFFNWLNDPANNISIGITRLGSFNNNGEMDPVYQFSTAQLTNLTNGITGHHPGKYALGLAVDPGGVTGYHFIPVE